MYLSDCMTWPFPTHVGHAPVVSLPVLYTIYMKHVST